MEDLEKVMSAGLGRQYAFIGPIEALYLECGGKLNVEKIIKRSIICPNSCIRCLFLMIHLLVRDSPRGPKN